MRFGSVNDGDKFTMRGLGRREGICTKIESGYYRNDRGELFCGMGEDVDVVPFCMTCYPAEQWCDAPRALDCPRCKE